MSSPTQTLPPTPRRALITERDKRTISAAIKLAIFVVISLIVTGTLAMIMGRLGANDQRSYTAIFTNASQLSKGDDVRVAGVSVGKVTDIAVTSDSQARVTFTAETDVAMTTTSGVQIRYLNLVGDRYLALKEGATDGTALPLGEVIPTSRTEPAINLTELFNGFQPLFQALNPADVNTLSGNLIKVLQGEAGTVQSLLAQTASLTSALADRDDLITSVISNLTTTMKTVDSHRAQLGDLVEQMSLWLSDLAGDKDAIATSITEIGSLTDSLAGLLTDARPWTKADIVQLGRMMEILNKPSNQDVLDETIKRLPDTLKAQARIGTHGSWYNYYLCDLDIAIKLPSLGKAIDNSPAVKAIQQALNSVAVHSTAKRCDP